VIAERRACARRTVALAACLATLIHVTEAAAYCRTTTCGPGECQASPDCAYCLTGGLPLYWPGGCTSFSAQMSGTTLRNVSGPTTGQIVENALAQWIGVDCGGGQRPSLALFRTQDVVCNQQEYNQDSPNANIWMYRDDRWPYAGSGSTLALTTVTFNVKTGEIYDADVEINSIEVPITVGDQEIQADLESIVTHEAGHFLGLSHSCDTSATMFANYKFGDTSLRTLEADDIAGVCNVYPPGKNTSLCDPTPRHGFSSDCDTPDTDSGCCTTAPGGTRSTGAAAVSALLLAMALGACRRRRR
jgi:hypothetical protein